MTTLDLHQEAEGKGKALPHAMDAEQSLLGAALFDPEAYHFAEGLEARHFYEPAHQRAWDVISSRIEAGKGADVVSVWEVLNDDPALQELGGLAYLADLIDKAPPARAAKDYAEIIIDRAVRRSIIIASTDFTALAADTSIPAWDHLAEAEQTLYALSEKGPAGGGFVSFGSALDGAMDMAAAAYDRRGEVAGLSTGLIDLDGMLGGLHPSDLVILAGRPSMGKTALATNIAFSAARSGAEVAFYSLEMSHEQLALRILADVSGVSSDRIRKGKIDASEFGRLRDARDEIRQAPLHIDATGGLPIGKLAARARRRHRKHKLSLIVVDYLQLVTGSAATRGQGRVQEVSEVTMALKALAKELGVPVLALSQLSRQVESREDKRPQLSDLRESGSIEQDADAVMFVYREEYYLGRTEPREGTGEHLKWCEDMSKVQGQAEVIIGKQRHGPIGTVRLSFNADLTKFGNLAREGRFDGGATRDFSEPTGGRE
jgi:replicative DNA helicase